MVPLNEAGNYLRHEHKEKSALNENVNGIRERDGSGDLKTAKIEITRKTIYLKYFRIAIAPEIALMWRSIYKSHQMFLIGSCIIIRDDEMIPMKYIFSARITSPRSHPHPSPLPCSRLTLCVFSQQTCVAVFTIMFRPCEPSRAVHV